MSYKRSRAGLCFLTDWAFSVGSSQSSLGEWKCMLLYPHRTFTPATMALCSRAHWTMTGVARERTDWYPPKRSIYLIIKILLCWGQPLKTIHMRYKHVLFFFFFFCPFRERSIHISLHHLMILTGWFWRTFLYSVLFGQSKCQCKLLEVKTIHNKSFLCYTDIFVGHTLFVNTFVLFKHYISHYKG